MWSRNYTKCIKCKSTRCKHMAKGLCRYCYSKAYWDNPNNQERIRKQKSDWFQATKDAKADSVKELRDGYYYSGNRLRVLTRDNFKCTRCPADKQLVVHHLDKHGNREVYDSTRNDEMSNLVTLCRSCHLKEHRSILTSLRDKKFAKMWTWHYKKCRNCGTTKRPHKGLGFCDKCYYPFVKRRKSGTLRRKAMKKKVR